MLVPPRQLAMISEFGVSEAPIYGPMVRFPVIVPWVSRLVFSTIVGPEAPAYEATVVTMIVLLVRAVLALLTATVSSVCVGLFPLTCVPVSVLMPVRQPRPTLVSRMWLRGCPGLVSEGPMLFTLSPSADENVKCLFGACYRFRVSVQVLISVIRLLSWFDSCRQPSDLLLTGKTL